MYNKVRQLGALAVAFMLVALLLGGIALPGVAQASGSGCRADPIVTLSDGTQVQIVTDIGTDLDDVQSIVYVLHAPVGTRVLSVLYTDSILGIRESLQFYADGSPNQYTTTTTVYTGHRNVAVDTTSTVARVLGLDQGNADGRDRQRLTVRLRP